MVSAFVMLCMHAGCDAFVSMAAALGIARLHADAKALPGIIDSTLCPMHKADSAGCTCHLAQCGCLLQGTEAAALVQDWVQAAQARAVAEQTSALLQAHAATLAASLSHE